MSYVPYENITGLRTWRQSELRLRRRIAETIVDAMTSTLRDLNQAWSVEEVEAPLMMPTERMSDAYTADDVFMLHDAPGGTKPWALRAETTDGTYLAAVEILRTTNVKAPLCVWQMGPSFRRERSDGATAEGRLRLKQFNQLEFQCVLREDTALDIAPPLREALVPVVRRITGLETRLVESDRLPSYATETIDIECLLPKADPTDDDVWREVASTSRRTDFPEIPGHKPLKVVEFAFGADRLVALANGRL